MEFLAAFGIGVAYIALMYYLNKLIENDLKDKSDTLDDDEEPPLF